MGGLIIAGSVKFGFQNTTTINMEMKNMKKNDRKTLNIARIGIGIALYVALSMTLKIPIIGNIGLDLGYIVLAVYAYFLGSIPAMIVGSCGCILISLLMNGWFPLGWALGQLFIGFICGAVGEIEEDPKKRLLWMLAASTYANMVGIGYIKTVVECLLYRLPFAAKFYRNIVAACVDACVMVGGVIVAHMLEKNGVAKRLHLN